MTEEEFENLKKELNGKFGIHQLKNMPEKDQQFYHAMEKKYPTAEDAVLNLESAQKHLATLNQITDYYAYFTETLVPYYIDRDPDGSVGVLIAGGDEIEEVDSPLYFNAKETDAVNGELDDLEEERKKDEQSYLEAKNASENKRLAYQERLDDLKRNYEEVVRKLDEAEASRKEEVETRRAPALKDLAETQKIFDDSLEKLNELTKNYADLSEIADKYNDPNNGLSRESSQYIDNVIETEGARLNMLQTQDSVKTFSEALVSAKQKVSALEMEYKDDAKYKALKENAKKAYEESLKGLAAEEKEVKTAEGLTEAYALTLKQQDEKKNGLLARKNELAEERKGLEKKAAEVSENTVKKNIEEEKEIIRDTTRYLTLHQMVTNKEPVVDAHSIMNGLDVVKEAYDSYHQSHNWFSRMFKGLSFTSAGKDYAKYEELRNRYMDITHVSRAEIDTYMDKERYVGMLEQTHQTAKALKQTEINDLENEVKMETKIPYDVEKDMETENVLEPMENHTEQNHPQEAEKDLESENTRIPE